LALIKRAVNLGFTYTGTEPVKIEWFKDGNVIAGANSALLLKNSAETSDSGIYSFTITNELGSVASQNIAVTVNKFIAPAVVTQFIVSPEDVLVGASITLSASAIGDGPFTFKWYNGDTLLASTDLPVFSLHNVSQEDSGEYSVQVSNQTSFDVSDTVNVSVVPPVSIHTSPSDVLVMEGSAFELTVEATGGGELRYAWYFNDELLDGVS